MRYTIQHSEHPVKKEIRDDIMFELYHLKSCNDLKILTLPHLNFDIETEAMKLGYHVDCVELDVDVFREQQYFIHQMDVSITGAPHDWRIHLHNNTLEKYLINEQEEKKYTLIYAVLRCQFCTPVKTVLAKLSHKSNVVYMTLMMMRELRENLHLFPKSKTRMENYRNIFFAAGYNVEKSWEYINNTTPMCTFK